MEREKMEGERRSHWGGIRGRVNEQVDRGEGVRERERERERELTI